MDNDNPEDLLNQVQNLRGDQKQFDLPADEPPKQTEPVAPVQPTLTPISQAAGNPPAFVAQPQAVALPPPQMVQPPPMAQQLTQAHMMQLMQAGVPLNPQQHQWLMAGYSFMQVLSPQQMQALGLMPPMMTAPPTMTPPPMMGMPAQSASTVGPKSSLFQQFENQVNSAAVGNFDYIDHKKTSIKFGIIGTGQGGSRIAEAFYHLGYPTCVVNTAKHDLQNINIPDENKLLLNVGAGGAGKDLQEGLDAATDFAEDILDLMKNTFPRDVEHILVCCGGGGGSGSGGLPKVIDMARVMNVPVGIVFTMPKDSEGSKVKENAFDRLMLLDKKLESGDISPLILVDNNKIHQMYTGVNVAKFWRLANARITGLFHLFNVLSAQNSPYSSFDPADYKTIIKSKGCMIFGSTVVEDSERKTAVAKALRDNIGSGLLAEGFDIGESKIAGVVVTGSQDLMENLPQENIDAAIECLDRLVGGGTLHHGIYVENVDKLTVYTIIGGLPLPSERIKKLLKKDA